jgi:hypothetical protein
MRRFRVRGYYPLGPGFPAGSSNSAFCNFTRSTFTRYPTALKKRAFLASIFFLG